MVTKFEKIGAKDVESGPAGQVLRAVRGGGPRQQRCSHAKAHGWLVRPLLYADGLLHHLRNAHLLRSESHDVCRLLQGYDMVTMHRYHSCSI